MKDSSAIWTFISTIIALAVAWAFTQATAWLTSRQADQRVRKEVLYFLLELYYQLIALQNLDKAGRIWVDTLFSNFGEEADEQTRDQLAGLYRPMLRARATPMLLERLAELQEGYQACLLKLATVDPLNASLLRGQASVLSRVDRLISQMQSPEQEFHLAEATPHQIAKLRQYFEDKLLAKTVPLLTDVIKELARTVGGSTNRKLVRTLSRRTTFDAETEKSYREMLTELPAILAER
jgi:hypothetical protein